MTDDTSPAVDLAAPEPAVLCGATKYDCICYEAVHEDSPHVCRCGGSWDQDGHVLAFPDLSMGFGAFPDARSLAKALRERGEG